MYDLYKDESGAIAVEYGLLLSLIFLAIIGAVTVFSSVITDNLYGLTANLFPH